MGKTYWLLHHLKNNDGHKEINHFGGFAMLKAFSGGQTSKGRLTL